MRILSIFLQCDSYIHPDCESSHHALGFGLKIYLVSDSQSNCCESQETVGNSFEFPHLCALPDPLSQEKESSLRESKSDGPDPGTLFNLSRYACAVQRSRHFVDGEDGEEVEGGGGGGGEVALPSPLRTLTCWYMKAAGLCRKEEEPGAGWGEGGLKRRHDTAAGAIQVTRPFPLTPPVPLTHHSSFNTQLSSLCPGLPRGAGACPRRRHLLRVSRPASPLPQTLSHFNGWQ